MRDRSSRDRLQLSDRVVDLVRGEVCGPGGEHRLTSRELELLVYLSRRMGQVVSRDELLVEVWGHAPDSLSRAVDLAIRRLRTKLEPTPRQPRHLLTVFGEGYRLVDVQPALSDSNLPEELDEMFGHHALLASLDDELRAGCRAMALIGPFGIGKTRLARALGARLRAGFPGGVWLVDLEACEDIAGTCAALVRAMRLQAEPLPDTVRERLAARPATLLILDGLDALPEAVDERVGEWLRRVPTLCVLLTARRPVVVPGVRQVRVPPLPTEDAVALLVDRAAAVGRDLSGEPDRCAAVVGQLNGQPLAIELAAVQTRFLSLSALLDRLGSALVHGQLEAILQSTWAALSPAARTLLEGCAVFAGGFTAEAAEAVIGQPILAALTELEEHSLVQTAPGSGRVRLHLMGSVRHFARLQASAAGTLDGLEARQVQWAARTVPPLAERVWRTGHPDAWAELEVERENLLHAWKRATDEDDRRTLLIALGPLLPEIPEAPRMLDAALSGASGQRRGTLLALQGGLLRIRGRLPEAADSLRAALRLLPEEHLDARGARLSLALLHTDSGEHDEALPLLSALAQAEPPDAIAGSAAVHWGQALHSLGQSTRARRVVLEGLDMLRDLGARRLMATTFNVLSRFHDEQEEQHLRDALAIHRQEGNRRGEAVTLTNLVNALADAGRWQEMWAVADEARAAHQALGARRSEGILLSNLCGIALSCWELDRAEALGQQAIRICRAHGVTLFEGQALLNLGIGALTERRHDDALARLQRARDIFDELDTPVMLAVVEGVIAATEAALDQPAAASARLEAVLASGVLDSRPVLSAGVGLQQGFIDLARARARPEEAAQHLAAARGRIAALQEGGTLRADLDTTEVRGMVRLLSEAIAWQTG